MSSVERACRRFSVENLRLNPTLVRLYVRSTNGESAGFAGRSVEAPGIKQGSDPEMLLAFAGGVLVIY